LSAGDAITAAGYQKFRLVCQAVAAAFNFGVNLYLIPRFSWRGAALSSLVTDALLAIFNWIALGWLSNMQKSLPALGSCQSETYGPVR
jgi:O-antigen/teichoic acid export membrane protein